LDVFGGAEKRLADAEHVLDEAGGRLSGDGSGFFFVDKIGEGEELRFGVEDGDGKVAGADEFVDDAVDGGEELLEILYGAGFLGDAIKSGAESLGALAAGDVAIQGVEGGGATADDKGGGGNGNIEQN